MPAATQGMPELSACPPRRCYHDSAVGQVASKLLPCLTFRILSTSGAGHRPLPSPWGIYPGHAGSASRNAFIMPGRQGWGNGWVEDQSSSMDYPESVSKRRSWRGRCGEVEELLALGDPPEPAGQT